VSLYIFGLRRCDTQEQIRIYKLVICVVPIQLRVINVMLLVYFRETLNEHHDIGGRTHTHTHTLDSYF